MTETTALDVLLQDAGAVPAEVPEEPIPQSLEEGSEGAGEPESPEADETETAEVPQTLSVKELAKLLERDPAELYSALQLDIGDEKMSLGALKDRAKELVSADALLAQATEQKLTAERAALEQNRALKRTAEKMGVQLNQDMIDEVNAEFEAYSQAEGQKLLEALPEWSDPDKQRLGLDRIETAMREFGFSDAEITGSVDHRLRLAFYQLGRLTDLLKDAAASEVKTRRKQAPKKQRRSAKSALDRVKQGHEAGQIDQTDAVLALIADGANRHGSIKS